MSPSSDGKNVVAAAAAAAAAAAPAAVVGKGMVLMPSSRTARLRNLLRGEADFRLLLEVATDADAEEID